MAVQILTGNDENFLIEYVRRHIGKGMAIFIYRHMSVKEADHVKRSALSGQNKIFILNGNNMSRLVYDALLKTFEESNARFYICTTKEVPATIQSRGVSIEILEGPESKAQKLVIRGVNRVEADELINIFGSVKMAIDIFEKFLDRESEYVTFFNCVVDNNVPGISEAVRTWEASHFKLLDLIITFLLSGSVSFGVRQYFISILKLSRGSRILMDNIKVIIKFKSLQLIRMTLATL